MNKIEFIKNITRGDIQSKYNVCKSYAKDHKKELPPNLFNKGAMIGAVNKAYAISVKYFMDKLEVITLTNNQGIIIKYY